MNKNALFILLAVLVVLISFFFNLPSELIFIQNGFLRFVFITSFFCLILFLVYAFILMFIENDRINLIIVSIVGLIVFIFCEEYFSKREEAELKKNGISTKCVVIKVNPHKKGRTGHIINECFCEFEDIQNKHQKIRILDNESMFIVGDTLGIKYLNKIPEIFRIDSVDYFRVKKQQEIYGIRE